jgi:hypothetical protein
MTLLHIRYPTKRVELSKVLDFMSITSRDLGTCPDREGDLLARDIGVSISVNSSLTTTELERRTNKRRNLYVILATVR